MRTTSHLKLALAVAALMHTGLVAAAGDPAAGKEKAAACAACHGPEGISIAGQWPNLAGQYADYLVVAMKQYQNGQRKNAIMAGMAANLSAEDIADLAAYYASLPGLESLSKD